MPKFFLDRSVGGKVVPAALRAAGWTLQTMHEAYGKAEGQRVEDVRWIREMTSAGFALVTVDTRIFRVAIEARAILEARAVVFAIPTGQITGNQMAERLVKHTAAIFDRARRSGPAGYAVYDSGISHIFPPS